MLLFTAKSRYLLDSAIKRLPDEGAQQLWQSWAKNNPQLRRPGGLIDDGMPPPSDDLIKIMMLALSHLESLKRHKVAEMEVSEDERSDLEGDITYIVALSQSLSQITA